MKPRLVSSKKWTPFPLEYTDQIRQAVQTTFAATLAAGRVLVEGRIYPEELLVRIGYLENGRLRQANFEASIEYKVEKDNVMQTVSVCLDALTAMMEAYFEGESTGDQIEFPHDWKPFEFLKHTVYLQFSTVNTELEAEADRILGLEQGSGLVFGEDDQEPDGPEPTKLH